MAVYRYGKYSFEAGDWTIRSDDSEIWVKRWPPEQRFNVPMQFVLGIESRRIGFSLTNKLTEWSLAIDPISNLPIYEIRNFGITVTRGGEDGYLKRTNTEKFENIEQQEKALKFISEGFFAVPSLTPQKTKEGFVGAIAKFSPELVKKFEDGDFIE